MLATLLGGWLWFASAPVVPTLSQQPLPKSFNPFNVTHSVPLLRLDASGDQYFCSAAPIKPHLYLSAGHCVVPDATFQLDGHPAQVEKVDKEVDLSLLSCPDCSDKPFPVSDREVAVGEWVVVLGWADGKYEEFVGTRILAPLLPIQFNDGTQNLCTVAGAITAAGMSGGPVINREGKLVGIEEGGDDAEALSVFVPLPTIRTFLGVK